MVSTEEILITMLGKDEVTPVVNNIQGNVNSSFSNMSQSASQSASSIGQAYQSTFDQIGRSISALNQGMMSVSSVSNMMLRELGGSKSASEYVYGTSAVAETNKVLMKSWEDTKVSYEDLYKTVDSVTDNSLTSMQELVPAMNAFRASTGASATQLRDDVTESMAQFGAYVKALTGSEQLAKTAMTDLSKGLVGKGSFNALDQYGVTRASLEARGWSGKNEDIKGYMEAVRDVAGQVDELMKTPEGASARLGKMWSRAGKKIGQEALPFVVNLKNAFMDLDEELDGNLSTTILRISLYIEEAQQKLYMFNTMWQGVKNISEAFNTLKVVLGFTKVEEEANNLMQEENNRLVQQSNVLLSENTDLRLANAEAMGLQNLQSTGYSTGVPYSDAMGMESEGESGSWGSDVLANTAGGLLESRYDKFKNSGDGSNGTNKSKGKGRVGGAYVGNVASELDEIGEGLQKNRTAYEVISKEYDATRLELIKSDTNLGQYGASYQNYYSKLSKLAESEARNMGSTAFDEMESSVDRPFRRLHTFFTEKRKRNFTLFEDIANESNDIEKQGFRSFRKLRLSFTNLKKNITGLSDLKGETKIDTLDNIWDGLRNSLNGLRGGREVMEETAVEMVETAGATGVVATGSEAVAVESEVAGTGMVEAETGLTFMGLAEMGLVGAFTTLIVPTLAIAGVIAVLIPIVAGLVAEALLFANLVGQFMASLNWNFDLSGIAEKFQELANALAWLGVTMASMTFASILTGITYFATGLGNVKIVFGEAMAMLRDVITILNQFQYTAQIDPNLATNLSNLSSVLTSVMTAMASLVGVQVMSNIGKIVTGLGFFGTLTGTLTQAKKDLQEAINVINQMDFTGIDENKINTLKTTLEAIGAFCDAFSGLNDIRNTDAIGDFTNWVLSGGIFGASGKTIQQAFESAHEDLVYASNALQGFTDVGGVDETVATNLQNLGSAISGVADAISSLRELRDSYNWDDIVGGALGGIFGGTDIQGVFTKIKTDLESVSTSLSQLTLADVPEDLPTKLQTIGDAVNGVSNAVNSIQNIPPVKRSDIGTRIRESTGGVQLAINGLKNIKGEGITESLGTTLTNVNTGITGVASAIQSALTIPLVDRTVIGARIRNAMDSVQLIINGLGRLKGQSISGDVSATLNKIKTDIDNLKTVLNNTNFSSQGKHMGSSLKSGVTQGMNGLNAKIKAQLQNAVNHSDAYNIGKKMGKRLTDGFKAGLRLLEAVQSKLAEIDVGSMIDSAMSTANGGSASSVAEAFTGAGFDMGIDSVQRYAMLNNKATASRINSLSTMGSGSNIGQTNSNPVNIIVNEGAVQLDARNLTTKESRQIMINALEGLPMINNIDVNGA